jgi:hypothetical protein
MVISACISLAVFILIAKEWYKNIYRILFIFMLFVIFGLLLLMLPVMMPSLDNYFTHGLQLVLIIGIIPSVVSFSLLLGATFIFKMVYDKLISYRKKYWRTVNSLISFFSVFLFIELVLFVTNNDSMIVELFREDFYSMILLPWTVVIWLSSIAASFIINKFSINEHQLIKISFVPSLNVVVIGMFIVLLTAILAQI